MKHPILTTTIAALLVSSLALHAEDARTKPKQNAPSSAQKLPETVVNSQKYSLTSPMIEVRREEIQRTPGGVSLMM